MGPCLDTIVILNSPYLLLAIWAVLRSSFLDRCFFCIYTQFYHHSASSMAIVTERSSNRSVSSIFFFAGSILAFVAVAAAIPVIPVGSVRYFTVISAVSSGLWIGTSYNVNFVSIYQNARSLFKVFQFGCNYFDIVCQLFHFFD